MKTYAIANQKGGVAKTTTAINFAAALGMVGKKVLVIDVDGQCNATTYLLQGRSVRHLKHLYPSVYDLMEDRTIPFGKAVRKTREKNVFIVPSADILKSAESRLLSVMDSHRLLKRRMGEVAESGFEYVIIDTPPGSHFFQLQGLFACDKVVVPTTYNHDSLDGVESLVEDLSLVAEAVDYPIQVSILFAQVRKTKECNQVRTFLHETYGAFVHPVEIPHSEMMERARSRAQSILRYAPTNPVSVAYAQFTNKELQS